MIHLILQFIFWIFSSASSDGVDLRNMSKKKAKYFIENRAFLEASAEYERILSTTFLTSSALNLNLASCYYLSNNQSKAKILAINLSKNENPIYSSRAEAIVGLSSLSVFDTLNALIAFRNSLLKNSDNVQSRYNYELLKKSFTKKINIKPRTQSNKNVQSPKNINEKLEKNNIENQELKKLKQMALSEQSALNILDAMKKSELQFLQQSNFNKKNKTEPSKVQW